jgi:enoyl-CoA hydratase
MLYRRSVLSCGVSSLASKSKGTTYQYLKVSNRDRVGLIQLYRPDALNALCNGLFLELETALKSFDQDASTGAIVLTGDEKAFAAGADIKEMSERTFSQNIHDNFLGNWSVVGKTRKPIIAAVNGFALGGGCELAMMCDIIVAGSRAKFGQPEIKLGTIPGGGGTQRLIRAIGKSRAMEMILTGKPISAEEAEKYGLVSRIFEPEKLVDEAVKLAQSIANFSSPVVQMAKEAVNQAYESTLDQGLLFERRLFHATFALQDQKEGMLSFLNKKAPTFQNQ